MLQRLSHYCQELAKPVYRSIENEPCYLKELEKEDIHRCARLMIPCNPPKILWTHMKLKGTFLMVENHLFMAGNCYVRCYQQAT